LMHPVHASWCSLSTPLDESCPRFLMHPVPASLCIGYLSFIIQLPKEYPKLLN
jgi:hypothetical protein